MLLTGVQAQILGMLKQEHIQRRIVHALEFSLAVIADNSHRCSSEESFVPFFLWPIAGLAWSSPFIFVFCEPVRGDPLESRYLTCFRVQGILAQDGMRRWEIACHQSQQPDDADYNEDADNRVFEWLRHGNHSQQPVNTASDQDDDEQINQEEHGSPLSQRSIA